MNKPKEPPLSKLSKLKVYYEMNITWAEAKIHKVINEPKHILRVFKRRKK